MTNEEKRAAIKKYFKPFPSWTIWMMIIGIAVLTQNKGGIVPIALGTLGVFLYYRKPSDAEMSQFISEDLDKALQASLHKSGIDASELVADAVIVTGFRLTNTGGCQHRHKKGGDGVTRFTPMNVTVINMTQNQLITYQACLDLTTGNLMNEETDEYFYNDVVSVSTKTASRTVKSDSYGELQLNATESFVLTTSAGTYVETILRDPKLIQLMGGGEIPTTEAERAIQSVRKMLRDKKGTSPSASL